MLSLVLFRWKMKARCGFERVWTWLVWFWHWTAEWPWFTVLFAAAIAVIAVQEYALGIFLFGLACLGAFSKLLHWNRKYAAGYKLFGSVLIVFPLWWFAYSVNAQR